VDDLEFVCNDANSEWKYKKDNDCYYRIYPNKTYTYIYGQYLPDPEELLTKKIEAVKKSGVRPDIEKLKSTPAIYSLFEHRKNMLQSFNN